MVMDSVLINRRSVMAGGLAGLALAGLHRRAFASGADSYRNEVRGYGPLQPDPAGLLDLPEGFSYRVISRSGARMSDGLIVPENGRASCRERVCQNVLISVGAVSFKKKNIY